MLGHQQNLIKLCLANYLQVGNNTHFKTKVEDVKMKQETK